jgi:hypothetical protein
MFYEVDGKPDKPRWFKLPVDVITETYGDMKNTFDVNELIAIYEDNGQDFFHELGVLMVNSIMYHCNRNNTEYYKMDKESSLLFRKIKQSGVDEAYKSWETKKRNLNGGSSK